MVSARGRRQRGGKGGKRGARASGEMAAMGVLGRSSAVGSRPRESLRATSWGGVRWGLSGRREALGPSTHKRGNGATGSG